MTSMKMRLSPSFVAAGITGTLSDKKASETELKNANENLVAICEKWEELTGEKSDWTTLKEKLIGRDPVARQAAASQFETICERVADSQGGYF